MTTDYAIITVKVNQKIKKRLEEKKIHRREPMWEVIERLLDYMDQQELTSDRRKNE